MSAFDPKRTSVCGGKSTSNQTRPLP